MKEPRTPRSLALHGKTKRQEGAKTWRRRERAALDTLTGSVLFTASDCEVRCTFKL